MWHHSSAATIEGVVFNQEMLISDSQCNYRCTSNMYVCVVYLQHLTLTSLLHSSSGLDGIEDKQEPKHTSLPLHITSLTQTILLPISGTDILLSDE